MLHKTLDLQNPGTHTENPKLLTSNPPTFTSFIHVTLFLCPVFSSISIFSLSFELIPSPFADGKQLFTEHHKSCVT